MSYEEWKMEIIKTTRYRIPIEIGKLQALIERGTQLGKEVKIRNYDEWSHLIWILKNKYRETTSENR